MYIQGTSLSSDVLRPVEMSESHMEVVCPGTWVLGLQTSNPGSKSTPKTLPYLQTIHEPYPPQPAPAQAIIMMTLIK